MLKLFQEILMNYGSRGFSNPLRKSFKACKITSEKIILMYTIVSTLPKLEEKNIHTHAMYTHSLYV
jgi:hypothetical protein